MSTIDIIETRVRGFISDIQHPNQKKKININDLEIQLRKLLDHYFEMDGYSLFYQCNRDIARRRTTDPNSDNNQYNGKTPALALYYWVNIKVQRVQMGSS